MTEVRGSGMRFLLKAILFCIPLAVFFAFPVWVLWRSGELMSNDAMVAYLAPTAPPVIVGEAYSNPICYLDLRLIEAKKPEVLVLGSSRVQQVRANFFNDGVSAFDASVCVQQIAHFRAVLDAIPAQDTPKVIIMGVDQRYFDPGYDTQEADNIQSLLTQPIGPTDVLANWLLVYKDYFEGKYSVSGILNSTSSVGIAAITHYRGTRNDGTQDLGDQVHVPLSEDPNLTQIREGIDGWEHSDTISQPALTELDAFLNDARTRGITVVGIIPPYSPLIYQTVQSMPDDYGYLKFVAPDVTAVFKKYNFNVYDFTDPTPLGITANDMQDGLHTAERGTLKFFIKLASEDSTIKQYANATFLTQQLNSNTKDADIVTRSGNN